MSTRAAALLQAALRRPVEDVLSRCKLSSKSPAVTTLTRTMSEAAPLILAKWPACRHQHVDEASPSDTQSFDLLLTGSCSPAHLAANLERVSPGGALAMAVSDPPCIISQGARARARARASCTVRVRVSTIGGCGERATAALSYIPRGRRRSA